MDSSEEEELFLLGFILLDDKKRKENKEMSILGSCDISPAWKKSSAFKSSLWALTWW